MLSVQPSDSPDDMGLLRLLRQHRKRCGVDRCRVDPLGAGPLREGQLAADHIDDRLVIDRSRRGDDDVPRGVVASMECRGRLMIEAAERSLVADDGQAERVRRHQGGSKQLVHLILGLVVIAGDLLKHHFPLGQTRILLE